MLVALTFAILALAVVEWSSFRAQCRVPRSPGASPPQQRPGRRAPLREPPTLAADVLPVLDFEDDDSVEPTRVTGTAKLPQAVARDVTFDPDDPDAVEDEPTGHALSFTLRASGKTDRGLRRKHNEDSMLVLKSHDVFAVADGMGGYRGGAMASRLAIEALADAFQRESYGLVLRANVPRRAAELVGAIATANAAVRNAADTHDRFADMGTTLVAARFCPKKKRLYVGHVGDSRCYRLRAGELTQLTRDHTMKDLGVVGRDAHLLSRAVGITGVVEPDVKVLVPRAGDAYLLCSDGLTKMVADEQIADVLRRTDDPNTALQELVEMANANGGLDNVTALLVHVDTALAGASA